MSAPLMMMLSSQLGPRKGEWVVSSSITKYGGGGKKEKGREEFEGREGVTVDI